MIRQVPDLPLYLAPGHINMASCETMMIRDDRPGSQAVYRLRNALNGLRNHPQFGRLPDFEWVFIDCPPSLGPLTQSAIVASSHLLVPTEAKMYAFAGMDTLNSMIQAMSARYDLDVRLLGVVITMFDRGTRLHRATETVIRERFGDSVFRTVIHRNVRISEAEIEGKPVISLDRRAAGARDYEALTEEILDRVAAEEGRNEGASLEERVEVTGPLGGL